MRPLLVLALAPLAVAVASAQPDARPAVAGPSVSLDVLWATPRNFGFATDSEGTILGESRAGPLQSVQVLSVRVPVGGRAAVVGYVPIVVTDLRLDEIVPLSSGAGGRGAEVDLGNPYVGAVGLFDGVSVEGGVWFPLAGGPGADGSTGPELVGFGTDYLNAEAYKTETASARVQLGLSRDLGPARVRLVAAPIYSHFVGERARDPGRSEASAPRGNVAATGAAAVDVPAGPVVFTGGLSGRYDGEGGRDTFIEGAGSWSYATLAATVGGLPVRPGLAVRAPLGGYTGTDFTIGVSLDVPLR